MSQVAEVAPEHRLLPWQAERLGNGKHLVTGFFGGWTILTDGGLGALKAFRLDKELYLRLQQAGILIDKDNAGALISRYVRLNRNLFQRTGLHIINLTNTCNYRCRYCHAGVSQGRESMSLETAAKAVKFILENSGPALAVEFQGGEPLLNWPAVQFIVERLLELNKAGKDLKVTMVSNLSLLTPERLAWLKGHKVELCTSLDGPADLHDTNRKHITGTATQEETVRKIRMIREAGAPFGGCLATITRHALTRGRDIVDEYVRLGFPLVHLRPLNSLGDALRQWPELSYTAEEFITFWKGTMEYILDLNRKGTVIAERGCLLLLSKMLRGKDPLYVEMMAPTGYGRATLLYNFDGGIYVGDEGRMLTEPVFRIGTVDDAAPAVYGNDDNLNMWAASHPDLFYYHCAFRPWLATNPILNFQATGNIIPQVERTFWHKVWHAQFRWIAEKLCEPGTAAILRRWTLEFC
jgi:His-Xaa-Ser system radical SAM maturase HxsB